MYYLISQFFWWLVLAFVLGLAVGIMTWDRGRTRSWGWLPVAGLIAAATVLLTVFRIVNGTPAYWLETAVLFFTTYIAGCFLGGFLRKVYGGAEPAPGVPAWNSNLGLAGPPLGTVVVEDNLRGWHADLSNGPVPDHPASAEPLPVARLPEGGVRDWHSDLGSARPEPVAGLMGKVDGEDMIAGTRPLGLAAPRGPRPDDLKLIRGIGKQNEGRLHGLGIWHFDQIAAWTPENALWVGSYLAFPGRIEREEWVAQAKRLAAGEETEFAGRVKRGEVSTSRDDGSAGQGNMVELDAVVAGQRPGNTLAAPRDGKGDDLKLVNGIGRVIEQKLHQIGIWHFDQIAAMSEPELRYISQISGFPGRALRENWAGEAAILAKGGDTAHSLAVKAGKIPSSLEEPS